MRIWKGIEKMLTPYPKLHYKKASTIQTILDEFFLLLIETVLMNVSKTIQMVCELNNPCAETSQFERSVAFATHCGAHLLFM